MKSVAILPFVYRYGMTKQELYEAAGQYVERVLALWGLKMPLLVSTSPSKAQHGRGGTLFGLYLPDSQSGTIFVNVERSTQPPRVRGRIWSYPGHKSDRTAAGILAHETGHYIWNRTAGAKKAGWVSLLDLSQPGRWSACKPITSYEPTVGEAFAETMRLFILNPELLHLGRPTRYNFLRRVLSLIPPHSLPWRNVLMNAPDFILSAAMKFVEGN